MNSWPLHARTRHPRHPGLLLVIMLLLAAGLETARAQVVINEIHYNPDVKTERTEFIELYNPTAQAVSLAGWRFSKGITYTFGSGASIDPGSFVLVSQDPIALGLKFPNPITPCFGPYQGNLAKEGEQVTLVDAAGKTIDSVDYQLGFPWPTVGDSVPETQPGTGRSIQLVNAALDNDLGGSWRSAPPTPGWPNNSVFAENIPPHIRQVQHEPTQPRPGNPVLISAKVTDADGVATVSLFYQLVDPGAYIALADAAYQTSWTRLAMNDAGQNGDRYAGDSIYSVQIPAALQTHRRLVRYRIQVADRGGRTLTVPYADDPQPNFAYFVYGGVPTFVASKRPGVDPEEVFTTTTMSSLPIYQLITKKSETEHCTWLDWDYSNAWRYHGTLVYDGQVLDHIAFRARGGVWRYGNRKNMWKFNLNRGHELEVRDAYGKKIGTKRNKLNFGSTMQMGNYKNRGEAGMYETIGYKLLGMVGMEVPQLSYIHFRIIDELNEDGRLNAAHPPLTTSGTQFDGDFWGLYTLVEEINSRFVDEHGLPDGNLYKMENYTGKLKNTNPYGPTDKSDLNAFMNAYKARPASAWWQANVEMDQYYGYRSIIECIHHYDIGYGKNYFYYNNPVNHRWAVIPWDINQSWATNMYGNGEEPFKVYGALNQPDQAIAYQNRLREIRDLLFNTDQTGQLIDEWASSFYTPGQQSFIDADRALWDYHWAESDAAFAAGYADKGGRAGLGTYYQIAPTKDFAGMLKIMKDWIVSRGAWVDTNFANDPQIPATPTVTTACPATFPCDALRFRTSSFICNSTTGTFAAVQWRIAEVEPFAQPSAQANSQTLIAKASTWQYFKGLQEPSNPISDWRQPAFNDAAWAQGAAPLGWGETDPFLGTRLTTTAGQYRSFYVRKKFNVQDPAAITSLRMQIMYDDGFNAWINGKHVASANMPGEDTPYDAYAAAQNTNERNWYSFDLTGLVPLVAGENVIAIQVQDRSGSTDSFVDLQLDAGFGTPGSATPQWHHYTEPGKYEIYPRWQSPELTAFADTVDLPTTAAQAGHTYRVRARMKDTTGRWSHWSSPVQFVAGPPASYATRDHLRISEVMYHPLPDAAGSPYSGDDFEFIEIRNISSAAVNLSGVALTDGVTARIPAGDPLQPGACAVVVKNTAAFRHRYGSGPRILAEFTGKLANDGELLRLADATGATITEFKYSDGRGWPVAADGGGHSIVALPYARDAADGPLDYGLAWRPSVLIGGSPGQDEPEALPAPVINEFLANAADGNDWIEIYNPTSQVINLTDYYLSDDVANPCKWKIPAKVIQPGEHLAFDARTGFNASPATGFALSQYGEQAVLACFPGGGQDRIVDAAAFKAQEKNIALGRYPDGGPEWQFSITPTRGVTNWRPLPRVVVNEVMYHPAGDAANGEFIEIYNPYSIPVFFFNDTGAWRLSGGVDFQFPADAALAPGASALIVGFNPADATALNDFLTRYGLKQDAVTIWGPYSGVLSNRCDRIALEKPKAPELAGDPLEWTIVDEVIYVDQAPFTPDADGSGKSLQRISIRDHGWAPANWKAGAPSPGTTPGVVWTQARGAWALYD